MQRLKKNRHIVIMDDGEIIGFDSREEFRAFSETEEVKRYAWLFTSTHYLFDRLMQGDEAVHDLERIEDIMDKWNYGHHTVDEALAEILKVLGEDEEVS